MFTNYCILFIFISIMQCEESTEVDIKIDKFVAVN